MLLQHVSAIVLSFFVVAPPGILGFEPSVAFNDAEYMGGTVHEAPHIQAILLQSVLQSSAATGRDVFSPETGRQGSGKVGLPVAAARQSQVITGNQRQSENQK